MPTFQPADTLRNRTFIALLVAQFLAAFNDQAIHASSMFFAINQQVMTENVAISLMPVLFYAPWALFCTLAGYLADRYSKRNSLVFWKVAEIGITLIALLGFALGNQGYHRLGPYLVLSTVFLMGTHSAFFVPAKYGAMPEILQANMLSRGNGVLESLSFLAVILGTVVGGVLSYYFGGREYLIGVTLTVLAVIGALASLFIRRMPAAKPDCPFPPYLFGPLYQSLRTLFRSRPLALAVVGIAFFTFLVAFMRATVYMHGVSQVPRWTEEQTSIVVGMVALGIGIGSPLVGYLSGGKVELGLVPIGALGMIAAAAVAALLLHSLTALIVAIILIGFFTGFYIVPLFTLLQHRAPRTSKGDSIATSNFINVTGAIIATAVFYVMNFTATHTGVAPALEQVGTPVSGTLAADPEYLHGRPHAVVIDGRKFEADETARHPVILRVGKGLKGGEAVIEREYRLGDVTYMRVQLAADEPHPVHNKRDLPRLLFLSAALMTLATLLTLWWQMPDLFLRTLLWFRITPRYRLEVAGMNHLPSVGPALLVTNAEGIGRCLQVLSATDRTTRFVLVGAPGEGLPLPLLRLSLRRTNLALLPAGAADTADWQKTGRRAEEVLGAGGVVGLSVGGGNGAVDHLLDELADRCPVPVVPVYYEAAPAPGRGRRQRVYVMAGPPLPPGTSADAVRQELERLADEFRRKDWSELETEYTLSGAH